MFRRRGRIELKNDEQLAHMRAAGLVVARALAEMAAAVAPGATTADLDALARSILAEEGARSSFLGYHGFPGVVCVSVNEEVVHGIPGPRLLREGDLVSIDFGAIVNGWHGDAAVSVPVGDVLPEVARLSQVTEDSMWAGLAAAVVGAHLTDVGHAVESTVRTAGPYGIVEEYVGHGIGSEMHMEPSVPNYGSPGQGPRLEAGMALAVEPMVLLGQRHVHVLDDDWTVVADDRSVAAHWEHTVAVTPEGPWVLTAQDGGAARFAAMGVPSPADRR
jgi:methionyl aminopeptidase